MKASRCLRAVAVLVVLAACGTSSAGAPVAGAYAGTVVSPPTPAPDFVLTATDGKPWDFARQTSGFVALLFFGYTHCPDVCPVHMTNIAAALHEISFDEARRVKVVFVTVDPDRDSLGRLRGWLDNFDPGFVGLRGPPADVARIETAFHLAPAVAARGPDGEYTVGHAAAVIAIVGDSVRIFYPFGTRQIDWARDLPKLVARIPGAPHG